MIKGIKMSKMIDLASTVLMRSASLANKTKQNMVYLINFN